MWRISAAAVRHYPHLFVGMFVALSLGVGLVGVTLRAILAAVSAPPGVVGETLTLRAGDRDWTVSNTPEDMSGLISVLGLGATVSAFVTITVVAGSAALSVTLRRRDIGLLRMAGAGTGTVRRMVLAEALVVAVPATAAGSLLAALASPAAFDRLNRTSLAAVDIVPVPVAMPLGAAAGGGLLMALVGALAASGSATRTRPHAALQEASLDAAGLTPTRTVLGLLMLGVGSVMVGQAFGMSDDSATPVAIFGTIFLTVGVVAFAPAFSAGLLRLLMAPLRAIDPVPMGLATASVGTARRRTSSLVVPVLGVLAVVGIFATVLATSTAGARDDLVARNAAQLVVTADAGLTDADLDTLRSAPGVVAVAAVESADVALAGTWVPSVYEAAAVDLPALAKTNRFEVVEGDLGPLLPDEVALLQENADWEGWRVGDAISYAVFGEDAPRTAKIAAILDAGRSLPPVILPEDGLSGAPTTARLRLADGADASRVGEQLRGQLSGEGVTVAASQGTLDADRAQQDRTNWIALLILAAPASAYAMIGIASAIVMANSRRGHEASAMRMLGLSRGQIFRVAGWEALGTTIIGGTIAAALVALGGVAFRSSVPVYGTSATLAVPWTLLLTVAGGCLVANVSVSVLSTAYLLRSRRPS